MVQKNIGNILMQSELYKEIENYFIQNKFNIKKMRMLEVGCANGSIISNFKNFGILDENITGIDIRKKRLEDAKVLYPKVDFLFMDAQDMSFEDNSFDIITVFTLFSSVLDESIKIKIASQIKRVLKDSGVVIYYDLKIPSLNNNVLSLRKNEICNIFLI